VYRVHDDRLGRDVAIKGEQRLKAAALNLVGVSYANPPPLPEADLKPMCSISCPASGFPLSWVAADPILSILSKHRSF
jgi:hypothetical protein